MYERLDTFTRRKYKKLGSMLLVINILLLVIVALNAFLLYILNSTMEGLSPYATEIGKIISSVGAGKLLYNTEALINSTCVLLHAKCV